LNKYKVHIVVSSLKLKEKQKKLVSELLHSMMNQEMQNEYYIWIKKWEVMVGASDMHSGIDSPTQYKMLHGGKIEEIGM